MIRLKQGDSVGLSSPLEILVDGVAVTDFTGWSATWQARTRLGVPIVGGACTVGTGVVTYPVAVPIDAPVGPHVMDLKFTGPGVVLHTVTVPFVIDQAITV